MKIISKILPWVFVIILGIVCIRQCNDKIEIRNEMNHNIEALTDSVKQYKTSSGDIAAEKAILIGDIDLLKKTNDSLYNKVKELGIKKPETVVYIKNDIIHEKHDTAWKIISPEMMHQFDFSNKWRELSGNVSLKDSIIGMTIDKDVVHIDYTMVEKDGRVYVSSENPYVRFNDIQGITLSKPKQKRFNIGPNIGMSFTSDGKIKPSIGIGITYSLISF